MKSDIQIARETNLAEIEQIAQSVEINPKELERYGNYIAKVPLKLIDNQRAEKSNLILVTAITPTKTGNGKTTVSIGLTLGLNKIGKRAVCALREPSLGPCFGVKGGAAGGGYAQVLPMEKINLHFTGDFHAVTSAHNMISALLDNYIYQHKDEGFALKEILWKRVLDVNDRSLRNIITGLGGKSNGVVMESGFDITPASEIMAILCLSTSLEDLRRRIDNILLGVTIENKPFKVKDMKVGGAIVALLMDTINPNLVQTTENTAAFVHGGPFANIAHGCNTILATKMAMSHSDYTITEAGFGADLGAEKFFNIKCRKAVLNPKLTVLIATTQALKMHGGIDESQIKSPNPEGIREGLKNLDRHIENLRSFGQTVVVTLNLFDFDTAEEIEIIRNHCAEMGVAFATNSAFADGGLGATELAQLVVEQIEKNPSQPLKFTYPNNAEIRAKIESVCRNIYRAKSVTFSKTALKQIERIEEFGMSDYPVCIAKTQYSFSADAKLYGSPENFNINIRDLVINSGSEMIVAIAGDIMRMPGLSKSPQAERIDVIDGQIEGLS